MKRQLVLISLVAVCLTLNSVVLATDRLVPSQYSTIQEGINAAQPGDTVIVAEGTYTGAGNKNLDYGGKAITVRSINPNDSNVVAATVIDCENSGRGFYFHNGEEANSIVSGLRIINGYVYNANGGGIRCTGSSPTIEKCIITNNWAKGRNSLSGGTGAGNGYGGGIFCNSGSRPRIVKCEISNNLASGGDGADYFGYGDSGHGFGGGICILGGNPTIQDCEIISNLSAAGCPSIIGMSGSAYGGGVYCRGGPVIHNCLVVNNEVASIFGFEAMGGGINAADTMISNCTICSNFGANEYDRLVEGIYGNSTTIITNCILWGNGDDLMDCSVTYSCIQNGDAGEGNINADPRFVTGPLGNYYLSQIVAGQAVDSPCVDSGSDLADNLGMDICTTRTDHVSDAGIIDMGYHYGSCCLVQVNAADINGQGGVDFIDYAILTSQWNQIPGIPSADIAPPCGDGIVDKNDLALLVESWLWGK